ncbi:VCBS repeat-containing protein [Flavitalea sp.]|nr:VCBS repeat-containing protein [Flavitalea sp.]
MSCNRPDTLFEKLEQSTTNIDFTNTITETADHNVFTYQYYYNGNGVAIGDVNNDGLPDVFFTGNQTPSKLYLNKGSFRFEDITEKSKVAGRNAWRTGANMVDINGDGLLDIYVCYSGFGNAESRAKQLFINKGNDKDGIPVFTEKSSAYGIDAPGTYSSQSAFFDYDLDGDLDMFLLNHANEFYSPFFNTHRLRTLHHPEYGNRLYRNDGNRFKDISDSAGIFGGGINFGLGISISDINNDGWPDIFVSNDFHEQDYVYLNNKDGTFTDVCHRIFGHMSRNTMGLDIADFNNDGLPDILTLDMLPESNYRQKILQGPDEYDKFTKMVDSGYGYQYNRNMLQLHRGFTDDGMPVFSEIGQLAGVSNTDWSWSALFADFDNDGAKDLFVTNGYLRESTNLDFMRYEVAEALRVTAEKGLDVSTAMGYAKNMPLYDLVKKMPTKKISNYAYRNGGGLSFTNETSNWGLDEESVSSGATYADLDNDGDLDLIVCNNNDPVSIFRNNADVILGNNFIKIKLEGDHQNRFAIGARVIVKTDSGEQMQEMYPVRGYQSSVDYVLNFGLGQVGNVKEIKVFWNRDSATVVTDPAINSTITISKKQSVAINASLNASSQFNSSQNLRSPNHKDSGFTFEDVSRSAGIDFRHVENSYIDFKTEYLIPYQLSRQGPKMAGADVNNDGLDDIFIGGAKNQAGRLYLQAKDGRFLSSASQPWITDSVAEDMGAIFFDVDGDGDQDLYVTSGGNEWFYPGPWLQDRLYINDSRGNFVRDSTALPAEVYNGSCVIAADYDKDGDQDLFVGAGTIPVKYPASAGNIILRNDFDKSTRKIRFTDVTASVAGNELFRAGMVNDAVWVDLNKDGWQDLIIAGDWMPVMVFQNENGRRLMDVSVQWGLEKSNGWWHKLLVADVDGDGDMDIIAGNLGLNNSFKTSANEPMVTYTADFNDDGRKEPVMSWYIQGISYPFNSRDELVEQMPVLNKRYLKYDDFAKATIKNLLGEDRAKTADKLYIYNTKTSLFINGGARFECKPLPEEAQFSVVSSIVYKDFDNDGKGDLLLAGNFYPFRVQQGRCDAGLGTLLKGNGTGTFTAVDRRLTGLYVPGDVRDALELKSNGKTIVVFSKNNDRVQVVSVKK